MFVESASKQRAFSAFTLPAGSTVIKYFFKEDAGCAVETGILPQITLVAGNKNRNMTLKVQVVCKHLKTKT